MALVRARSGGAGAPRLDEGAPGAEVRDERGPGRGVDPLRSAFDQRARAGVQVGRPEVLRETLIESEGEKRHALSIGREGRRPDTLISGIIDALRPSGRNVDDANEGAPALLVEDGEGELFSIGGHGGLEGR